MKKSIFISVFGCLLLFSTCKKADLPKINDPVFSLNGKLDDVAFDLTAGVDSNYMLATYGYTPFDSTKLVYRADLGPIDNLPERIVIDFIQQETSLGSLDVNKTIREGEYLFATSSAPDSLIDALEYSSKLNGIAPISFTMKIGNVLSDVQEGLTTDVPNNYVGAIYVSIKDELNRTSTQKLWADLPAKTISGVAISYNNNPNNPTLTAHVFGENPSTFEWSGPVSNPQDTFVTLDSMYSQSQFSITVKLANNETVTNSIDFNKNDEFPCNVQLSLSQVVVPNISGVVKHNYENGRVIVKYLDRDGQVYSSESIVQPTSSFFNIIKAEEYEINDFGLPTKKLDVDFNCQLMNEDRTSTRTLSNVKGTIGIGYPK